MNSYPLSCLPIEQLLKNPPKSDFSVCSIEEINIFHLKAPLQYLLLLRRLIYKTTDMSWLLTSQMLRHLLRTHHSSTEWAEAAVYMTDMRSSHMWKLVIESWCTCLKVLMAMLGSFWDHFMDLLESVVSVTPTNVEVRLVGELTSETSYICLSK